ncbi:YfhO family protein [Arthrobacter sp. zg-Y826]|uniref:YfhO family protein n=1 Tax=Arthrobacter jinronghuae TaxID=2964609 RepID=UPI002107B4DA|nr:YfhO family protein [Arthrobacter jinronghuae]MCQ1955063.1 YfhO family protein [Arthrobacter jinronghuae]
MSQRRESGTLLEPSDTQTPDGPSQEGRKETLLWGLVTVAATFIGSLIPLIPNPRFYFYDDTQAGAYGIWVEIGESLRRGEWWLFSDEAWAAGNYAAEGQWGLWNPLIMLIGLMSTVITDAVLFSTILKIALMLVLALGTFLLARSYRATAPWAAVAGVAVTLTGFTTYFDGSSWVTGLMVFALLPWAWWGLRRLITESRNPAPALIFSYLLITVGYVHGTIMLVIVFLALLIEVFVRRTPARAVPLVVSGVILGMVALTVYLPGVLTAGVTARASDIGNSGFLGTDLTGLASAAVGSALPQVSGWWGAFAPVPVLYIAWFLPLVGLVSGRRIRGSWPALAGLVTVGVISLMLTLAPSDLGPLRFPIRLVPYVSLTALVLLAVLLSRFRVRQLTGGRIAAVSVLYAAGMYLAWSQNPNITRIHFVLGAVAAVGLICAVVVLYAPHPLVRTWGVRAAAAGIILVSLVAAVGQKHYFPSTPLPDFHFPESPEAYDEPLAEAEGMTFVVGEPDRLGPAIWADTLASNAWYLSDIPTHNLYSPIMFAKYSEDLCMTSHGWTCQNAADSLFTVDEETGELLVDLLSIDTVQILRDPADTSGEALKARMVPEGWNEVERTGDFVTWVRAEPLENNGEAVWATPGTRVSTVSDTSQELVLHVDEVPDGGAEVVTSRLAWPGYDAEGASIADPLRGYLLTVDVPAGSEGQDIRITFEPPAWPVLVVLIWSAIGLGALWSVLHLMQSLRRRNRAVEPNADGPVAL